MLIPGFDDVVQVDESSSHVSFRAREAETGRSVRISVFSARSPLTADDVAALARFRHPNVVRVVGHGVSDDGELYLVTIDPPETSIIDRLRGARPMTGPEVLSTGVLLAGALESLHRAGLAHGDVRPGIVKMAEGGEPLLTGFAIGTASDDVTGLATTLSTLFLGSHADTESAASVPAAVAGALRRGYATAQDFGRALQDAQVTLGLPVTQMTIVDPPVVETPMIEYDEPPAPPERPRTALIFGAIAVVVAILAIVFAVASRDDDTKTAEPTGTATQETIATTTTTTATSTTAVSPTSTISAQHVVNDGGQLEVSVPKSWSQKATTDAPDGFPSLQVGVDLAEFNAGTYQSAGLELRVVDAKTLDVNNLSDTLREILIGKRANGSLEATCTLGPISESATSVSGLSVVRMRRLRACNDAGDVVIFAATNSAKSYTAFGEIHLGTTPDEDALETILETLNVVTFP